MRVFITVRLTTLLNPLKGFKRVYRGRQTYLLKKTMRHYFEKGIEDGDSSCALNIWLG
jgi:hypothetical protein